jgi:hypothetical protein
MSVSDQVTIDFQWFNIMVFTYLNYYCIDSLLERWCTHKEDMKDKELEGRDDA